MLYHREQAVTLTSFVYWAKGPDVNSNHAEGVLSVIRTSPHPAEPGEYSLRSYMGPGPFYKLQAR